jgi:hypothetical protein
VLEVKNICANNIFGMRFFEIKLVDEQGFVKFVNINLSKLKELNVTKSMNGIQKS